MVSLHHPCYALHGTGAAEDLALCFSSVGYAQLYFGFALTAPTFLQIIPLNWSFWLFCGTSAWNHFVLEVSVVASQAGDFR